MTDQKEVRTRFAPSPTGALHIGGLRTALFAWLFAKKNGGKFLLRLEDTDQKRKVEGSEQEIVGALEWAGIVPDFGFGFEQDDQEFGSFLQSERLGIYEKYLEKLLESGDAYFCFCDAERLEKVREEQRAKKLPPRYDRKCAGIDLKEARERVKNGEKAVVRFRLPDEREVVVSDVVFGEMKWNTRDLQDMVIWKSDGFPTYHLAVVVDDFEMKISHVMRGEEWLSSLPIHVLMMEALGFEKPVFAHLPSILGEGGKKLSKREGDVSVSSFIKKGVLPEAMVNFLVLLGWNPGDEREFFSLEELVREFDLKRVHKSGAFFDMKKLENVNGHWIKEKSGKELVEAVVPFLEGGEVSPQGAKFDVEKAVKTVQGKMKWLSEAPDLMGFFWEVGDWDDALILNEKMKVDKKIAQKALDVLTETLSEVDEKDWNEENLKEILFGKVEELGWKNGQLLWPMRVALTGESFSPGAFEVAGVLGKEESLRRIEDAKVKIK